MLSKNKIKHIQSLSRKKVRDTEGLFLAEGEKLVAELMEAGFEAQAIFTTKENILYNAPETFLVSTKEMKKISLLKTPGNIIAVCKISKPSISQINPDNELVIVLDSIQDPGNLGTIIRLASWFGIKNIVCSEETVDCYNPKTVQSTMGALAHVNIHYTKLIDFLGEASSKGINIYGTFLEGANIYESQLSARGIVVLGNEGSGISTGIEEIINYKLHIPSFSENNKTVESLNVSMAAAIICSEFRRRSH
jgi:TrmH family RNA methyltransferase